ncbi:MAG: 2-phospho-L-lactate guanylyltransferase [Methanotrichaceae archaeon]
MRSVRVVIPFKLENAKSRLADLLSPDERKSLALTMLGDVVESVSDIGEVVIFSRSRLIESDLSVSWPLQVIECDKELDSTLNLLIENWQKKGWPSDLLVAMADLPLMRAQDVRELIQIPGDVVIAPGRGGGTNLILIRDPRFRVCYYGLSFLKHLKMAQNLGLSVGIYESYRCGCDIDEPSDLVEVLIHGEGQTPKLLKVMGVCLDGDKENVRADCLREVTI